MRLVQGHRVNGRWYQFPHACPDAGCAIRAWLAARERRRQYERISS